MGVVGDGVVVGATDGVSVIDGIGAGMAVGKGEEDGVAVGGIIVGSSLVCRVGEGLFV
jgi:hypothetical protein